MKRLLRYIILSLAFGLFLGASAETVSQKQAKQLASLFFSAAKGVRDGEPRYVYNGKNLTTGRLFSPFYVFNSSTGGFVVVSAENKAHPILGYSLTETFSPDVVGPSLHGLLSLYANHIENVRYSSIVPEQAIKEWNDPAGHIAAMLEATYDATDLLISKQEAAESLDYLTESFDAETSVSGYYDAAQWLEMIDIELADRKNVPLAFISPVEIIPTILQGKKGDFYRLSLDGANRQLWRLLPTEIISVGEMALFGIPPKPEYVEQEEQPFVYYDSIVRSLEEEQQQRERQERLSLLQPLVQWQGMGHYTITLPKPVMEARVFGLDGTRWLTEKFRDTNVANLNLTKLPTGFYLIVVTAEDGERYEAKIFR